MKEEAQYRCPWLDTTKPDYVEYHDHEWGVPVYDDQLLFEFLTLPSFVQHSKKFLFTIDAGSSLNVKKCL